MTSGCWKRPERAGTFDLETTRGDDLVTMYFHLSEIKAAIGQAVTRGQATGVVGTTGRSTGPHLFFGVSWHDARVDPMFLLGEPGEIPSVSARR